MKKFTAILLTLVLALSLAACGSDTTTASDGEGTTAPATEPQDTTTQEDTNAGTASVDTGRTLVVYFSATTWSWPMTQKEHFPSRRMASSLWPALAQWKYSFPLWYT